MVWRKCERHDEDGSLEENEERKQNKEKEVSIRKCRHPRKRSSYIFDKIEVISKILLEFYRTHTLCALRTVSTDCTVAIL